MGIKNKDDSGTGVERCVMCETKEEAIYRKISKLYEGKDWHKLSLEEREIVGDLVQAGWLDENRPANGFVGKAIT